MPTIDPQSIRTVSDVQKAVSYLRQQGYSILKREPLPSGRVLSSGHTEEGELTNPSDHNQDGEAG